MNEIKASVLMPVLGTPVDFLREAVDSILSQTESNLELIIVEDPSGQPCTEYLASLRDARIRYFYNEQRTGLVAQRNLAVSMATGEFIVKADSDDVSEPDRIERQIGFLIENSNVGVVGSALTIINSSGERQGIRKYPTESSDIHRMFRWRNPIAQPAACFRRSLVDQFGSYPDGFPVCQDYAYWSHLAVNGVRFANLWEPLVRYRQHDRSIKSTRLRETLDATIRIKKQYWNDDLTYADRLRIAAEHGLKYLPPALVQRLFLLTTMNRKS